MANSGAKHARFKDLIGHRFGRLEVIMRMPGSVAGGIPWMCRCDCGKFSVVPTASLRGGNTKSCGCAARARTIERNYKHGLSKTVEYAIHNGIKTRCYNTKRPEYVNYGGRGIGMCDRWRYGEDGKTGFECFLADVGKRPTPLHSIERIDNNGHYEPGNVKWATVSEQVANRRCNILVCDGGEQVVLGLRVAEKHSIAASTFHNRVRNLKWSPERAASTPVVPNANQTTYD